VGAALGRGRPPGDLPVPPTRLIGRDRAVADLLRLIRRQRLVTLVGPPGCGKTRLVVEVARGARHGAGAARGRGSGTVSFVDLAAVSAPHLVPHAVAAALGLPERYGVAADDLVVEALAESREPRLLVLDNCEHVAGAVSDLIGRVVASCPAVRAVATSRLPLDVPGERVWRVPSLAAEPAAELFVERARHASTHGWPEDAEPGTIAAICSRLDGLPLAIELAAAWVRVLSLGEIAGRLDRALLYTSSGGARRDPRHETMEATVAWSYRLLAPGDRVLFQRLAVFVGGFDLEAAEALAGVGTGAGAAAGTEAAAGPGGDVLAGIVRLVDQSLVVTEPAPDGPMRYRVLEAVRQYGTACLLADGGERGDAAVRRRHAEHYLSLARRADPFGLREVRPKEPFSRLVADEGNVLAAVGWARAQPDDLGLRLCAALGAFWEFHGPLDEGRTWLEEQLACGSPVGIGAVDDELRMEALWCAAKLAWRQGDRVGADALVDRGLALAGTAGDEWWSARLRACRALATLSDGDAAQAIALCEQNVALFRARGDRASIPWSMTLLGWARYMDREVARGDEAMQEALDASRAVGNHTAAAQALFGLAYGAFLAEDTPVQREHLVTALDEMQQAGGCVDVSDWLGCAGSLAAREGRPHAALRLIGGATAFRTQKGSRFPARIAKPIEDIVIEVIEALGPPTSERLLADGGGMALDDLVDHALRRHDDNGDRNLLSRRERQVAELVGHGLTNVEVAGRLAISRRTVETHVEHIKQKLQMSSRHQVMAWALQEFTD
jgi:predicted ATPase/DNA-binding CsgD family transcriptional regulator